MKSIISSLLFFMMLLTFSSAEAQLSSLGMDRSIGGSGQFKPTKDKSKKEFDFVQASTDNMTKQLKLDGFQSAAVKNIIEDYKNRVISISAETIPDEGKMEKMEKEKDKMETKILALLNKDQVVLFQEMKDKKEKKGKKKGKDKDEE